MVVFWHESRAFHDHSLPLGGQWGCSVVGMWRRGGAVVAPPSEVRRLSA